MFEAGYVAAGLSGTWFAPRCRRRLANGPAAHVFQRPPACRRHRSSMRARPRRYHPAWPRAACHGASSVCSPSAVSPRRSPRSFSCTRSRPSPLPSPHTFGHIGFCAHPDRGLDGFRQAARFHAPDDLGGSTVGRAPPFATVVVGVVLGALVTLSSVGAGALGAAALAALYPRLGAAASLAPTSPTRFPSRSLLAWAMPASAPSTSLAANLLVGSLPGVWLGCRIADRLPENGLRALLAGMLTIVGGKLAFL